MLYELRIYHCVTGRLPALLDRFDNITLKLWEKHNIKQAGFWTTEIGPNANDLYYLLQWESPQKDYFLATRASLHQHHHISE